MLRFAALLAFAAASAIGMEDAPSPGHRPMPLVGPKDRQKLRYHIENVSLIRALSEEFSYLNLRGACIPRVAYIDQQTRYKGPSIYDVRMEGVRELADFADEHY